MIESIIVDEVIKLLNSNIECLDETNIPSVAYNKTPFVRTINEIDIFFKKKINELVQDYGIVGTLIRIQNLRGILSSFPDSKDQKLLLMGSELLFDRVKSYYNCIVYARLIKWLPRLKNCTIMEEEILDDVKVSPFNEANLLGINGDSYEQTSLFSNDKESDVDIFHSVNAIYNIKEFVTSRIKALFKEEEFNELCDRIIMYLNFDISPQADIFLESLIGIKNNMYESPTRKRKQNKDQLKLTGF